MIRNPLSLVETADLEWLRDELMPTLNIQSITVAEDLESRKPYPDIWCLGDVITVTREWAKQPRDERRKRLLHEAFHILGMRHDSRIGYHSRPNRDTYSRDRYRELFLND